MLLQEKCVVLDKQHGFRYCNKGLLSKRKLLKTRWRLGIHCQCLVGILNVFDRAPDITLLRLLDILAGRTMVRLGFELVNCRETLSGP